MNKGSQSDKLVAVAPMMAWTDRHCRYLHRLHSPSALLFTEMVSTGALLRGGQWHQLDHDAIEQPVVLQLGGNDPGALQACTIAAVRHGYHEVNLNVGCPSQRVLQGTFGACLMLQPDLVADCIKTMLDSGVANVSVKCRLGVDEHDSDKALLSFVETVAAAGCGRFYIHARKAILGGLSPAQNRSIPPLQPWKAKLVKKQFPHLEIIVNGGISCIEQALTHLSWADGVMLGRAAYHKPQLLTRLHQRLINPEHQAPALEILTGYLSYMERELAAGTRLNAMTRHLLHCCNGVPGARKFRQTLSDSKRLKHNDLSVVHEALAHVFPEVARCSSV